MINSQAARDNPAVDVAFLPPSKATNKRIFPVQNTGGVVNEKGMQTPPVNPKPAIASVFDRTDGGLLSGTVNVGQPKTEDPFRTPDFNPTTKPTDAGSQPPTTAPLSPAPVQSGGGLLQNLVKTSPIASSSAVKAAETPLTYKPQEYKPVSSEAAANAPTINVPTASAGGSTYKSDGYTGIQGNTNFTYKPSEESLVENRIGGLLDPDSALMRKASALGNAYAANRGLQSSSIGGEIALSTMVDKAMPIAQQDAQTFNQAQQLGWQQGWQSGENNLNRTHDTKMFDKNGALQTDLQNSQQKFQASENNANRQMQAELQQLQYKQSLGLLDAQGAQRIQELNAQAQVSNFQQERGAQLQTERDKLLQNMSLQSMDKQYLQQLELNKAQYDQADRTFATQLEAGKQAEYRNAISSAYNTYLQQVGAIYADPNMTSDQKAAGASYLQQQLDAQRKSLETLYLITGVNSANTGTPPQLGTPIKNLPTTTTNPVSSGSTEPRSANGKGYVP